MLCLSSSENSGEGPEDPTETGEAGLADVLVKFFSKLGKARGTVAGGKGHPMRDGVGQSRGVFGAERWGEPGSE